MENVSDEIGAFKKMRYIVKEGINFSKTIAWYETAKKNNRGCCSHRFP
jgi:hypothetical protein